MYARKKYDVERDRERKREREDTTSLCRNICIRIYHASIIFFSPSTNSRRERLLD